MGIEHIMLITPTFLSSVLTAHLNKRLVFLASNLKPPLACLKDTSQYVQMKTF